MVLPLRRPGQKLFARRLEKLRRLHGRSLPEGEGLLAVALHFSLEDAWLPVIATLAEDYSVPFPNSKLREATGAR